MLKPFWVDLHIHTVLSPCGELEMGAPEIVQKAIEQKIDIIGISDHNTCENYPALCECAQNKIKVLSCIEIQSAEDIHLLTIFPTYDKTLECKNWYWDKMQNIKNDSEKFGYQLVINKENEIEKEEEKFLIQGVGYEIDQIIDKVHDLDGIAILAHVDRPSFSYPVSLGPIPQDYKADAFELSSRVNSNEADIWRINYPNRTFIRSSDSHELNRISRLNCTKMMLEAPTFNEIKMALHGEENRRVVWPWG
ncbi:MAG: PHP domain-containing protein [Synergistaceae bacterium]